MGLVVGWVFVDGEVLVTVSVGLRLLFFDSLICFSMLSRVGLVESGRAHLEINEKINYIFWFQAVSDQ